METNPHAPNWRLAAGTWLVAFLVGSTAGLLLRLGLFLFAVVLVQRIGEVSSALAAPGFSLDPIYSHAAQRSLIDLHVQGIAVGGPPGAWLHGNFAEVFVDASRARWGLVRIVVEPGSPVLGRILAAGVAHAGVLGVGLLVVGAGWLRRRSAVIVAGAAIQVQVALGIVGAPPSPRELEATGVSFAMNAVLPSLGLGGAALTDASSRAWPPLVAAGLVGLALMIAYVPTGLVLLLHDRTRRITFGTAAFVVLSSAACAGLVHEDEAAAASVSPTLLSAVVSQDAQTLPPPSQRPPTFAAAAQSLTIDRWFVDAPSVRATGPSHVEITGSNAHYQYLVNGRAEIIQGMGLNTQYTYQLSPSDRAARLDADMASLHALGVNTVLGWDPSEFDSVLLDAAQRHDIGVVMPFDLDPDADYTDPTVRRQLHDQVLLWVSQYRTHPALRMWGLGNEVLHKIVHPAWVGPQDPARARQAEAFSDWLIDTADAIHALDPDHPVTYRSAEDAFVDWVAAALARRDDSPRPWFLWGTNCYQSYLGDIVDRWPQSGIASPLWVSEFAPGGMAVPDRPDGFASLWALIRRNPDWVLGGAVYAWTRNGPEGVDRNFGLTDDGQLVDGRSLDMLHTLFHGE